MNKRIFSIAAVATLVGLAACGGEEAAVEGEVVADPAVVVPVDAPPATATPMPGDTMGMGTTPMTGDTMGMGTTPMTGDSMNMGAGTTTPTP